MAIIKHWLKKAQGEISKLRIRNWFFNVNNMYSSPYSLGIEGHTDYKLARDLYYNRDNRYKLGAGFAKPIINTLAGFMGTPTFICKDDNAQEILDEFIKEIRTIQLRIHQKNLIDGETFVRLLNVKTDTKLYPENKNGTRLMCMIIPPEMIPAGGIEYDPVTGAYSAITIKSKNKWIDVKGNKHEYIFKQRITAQKIITNIEGHAPEGVVSKEEINNWGFIPIVHFKNEPDERELHGFSELEPIEPFLKAYHDVMIHAISSSKIHSTPKIKLKLNDVSKFLQNNFPQAYKDLKSGKETNIDIQYKDILLMSSEDDAEYIECTSAIGDTATLLQFLFYCIIDTSEVPEFAFGVHITSSQASVKEQTPILIRRIQRKREQVEKEWLIFARMALSMLSVVNITKFNSFSTEIKWDAVMDKDQQADAQTLQTVVQALATALDSNIISLQSAVTFLSRYIDTMGNWEEEKPKIEETKMLNKPLEEPYFQNQQVEQIDKILGDEQ